MNTRKITMQNFGQIHHSFNEMSASTGASQSQSSLSAFNPEQVAVENTGEMLDVAANPDGTNSYDLPTVGRWVEGIAKEMKEVRVEMRQGFDGINARLDKLTQQ
jgi:hypothetical protein